MPSGVQVVANNAGGFSLVDNTGGYFVCTGTFSPVFAGQTWVTTSAGATMVDTNSVPLKPGTEITVVAGRVYAISGTGTVVLKPKP